jgi:hypothetical protein
MVAPRLAFVRGGLEGSAVRYGLHPRLVSHRPGDHGAYHHWVGFARRRGTRAQRETAYGDSHSLHGGDSTPPDSGLGFALRSRLGRGCGGVLSSWRNRASRCWSLSVSLMGPEDIMHPRDDKSLFGPGGHRPDGRITRSVIPDEHYSAVGKVSDAWADLEFEIDFTIWKLQEVDQQEGACVTSQLISVLPKLDALLSLVRHWNFSADLDKRLGRFKGEIGPMVMNRNRIVHDKRVVFHERGRSYVARFEVSAKSTLKYGPREETIDSLTEFLHQIYQKLDEFDEIKKVIDAEWPTLHDKYRTPPLDIEEA